MHTLYDTTDVPDSCKHAALAIGNFDGVHQGHQALLNAAIQAATSADGAAGVMVFEPHPREFFQPDEAHFRLTPLETKLEIFDDLGLDFSVVMTFDKALAALTADAFCQNILVDRLAVDHVIVGYDFFFGKGREGSPQYLKEFGAAHDFQTTIIAPVAEGGEAFSSTAVRLKLAQGDVKGAAHALGRWWQVAGTVTDGAHRGTRIGYPTANIPMPKGTAISHGIYAVRVHHRDKVLDGAAYLGTRPTFDDGKPVLEVFLFDFDGNLYGQTLAVQFIDFIRPDRKFDSTDALVEQMTLDCQNARARLAAAPNNPK